ncbi:MAG: hypothetical protein LBS62_07335 [Clostridiales bacterium]|nr:hypothetical protein [Clostridiales bacterium]
MIKCDLAGKWNLRRSGSQQAMDGHLPGCNYLDMLDNRVIDNPFWEINEAGTTAIARATAFTSNMNNTW